MRVGGPSPAARTRNKYNNQNTAGAFLLEPHVQNSADPPPQDPHKKFGTCPPGSCVQQNSMPDKNVEVDPVHHGKDEEVDLVHLGKDNEVDPVHYGKDEEVDPVHLEKDEEVDPVHYGKDEEVEPVHHHTQ